MRELHGEGLASHPGPESCGYARKGHSEALTGVRAGRPLSRETRRLGCRRCPHMRKATPTTSIKRCTRDGSLASEMWKDPTRSRNPSMYGTSLCENRETPCTCAGDSPAERAENPKGVRQR